MTDFCIIYKTDEGGVAVVIPWLESGLTVEQIAAKDVPAGKPHRIIDAQDLPSKDTRDRWRWSDDGAIIIADAKPAPVPASMSFAQLLTGLVSEGWIAEAEGDAWLGGTLPAPVAGLIGTLPQDQRFAAKAKATRPSEVLRADPLVMMLAAYQGKTSDDLDAFFRTYAQV